MLKIDSFKQAEWTVLPREGCHNVRYKALQQFPGFELAMLKFEPDGTIDVLCLEGEGMISMGDEQAPFKAGQRLRWVAGINHRLWTTDSSMVTLMVEHVSL